MEASNCNRTRSRTGGILGILILLLFLVPPQAIAEDLIIYVSPHGNNFNPGTSEKPLKTLHAARDFIRALSDLERNRNIEVILGGGTYFLTETFVLGLKDGGKEGYTVTYKAYPGELAILSSGVGIRDWKKPEVFPDSLPLAARDQVWQADIPEGVERFYVMYDGYKRLQRARSKGFHSEQINFKKFPSRNVALPSDRHLLREIHYPPGEIKDWTNLEDIEVFFCPVPWCLNFSPLQEVDTQEGLAIMKYEANSPPFTTPKDYNPAWVENAIDFLDEPGEWVVDTRLGKIWYWPVNEDPGEEIMAPRLKELVRVEGKIDYDGPADTPVTNLVFDGIQFMHTDRYSWWEDHKGWGIQHDWDKFDHSNAMLRFRGAENCRVRNCRFTSSGGSAIRLDLHCQGIEIRNNLIDHVGHMGILLCGYGPGTKDVNRQNIIENNIIDHCGEVVWHGHAIFVWQSGENRIANNRIQYCPRKAVGICGVRAPIFKEGPAVNWDEGSKTLRWHEMPDSLKDPGNVTQESILPYLHARKNLVKNNYLYRIRTKIGDGAALNVSGAGKGNVIRNNFLTEITGNGMRTDDWQRGTLFKSNLITDGGIVHKGHNDIINNILVNTNIRFTTYPGQVYFPGSVSERNLIYTTDRYIVPYKERKVKEFSTPDDCILRNNLYYSEIDNDSVREFLEVRQSLNWEEGSINRDPGFETSLPRYRDIRPEDLNIGNSSPLWALGFERIEAESIGITDEFPEDLAGKVFPDRSGDWISENASWHASSIDTSSCANTELFLGKQGDIDEDVVLQTAIQENPYVSVSFNELRKISGFEIIAPMKTDREAYCTLTVWVSENGEDWYREWSADPYHVEMPRRWQHVFPEAVRARYIRIGLGESETLSLKNICIYGIQTH